jgi:hypothetical protein
VSTNTPSLSKRTALIIVFWVFHLSSRGIIGI